MERLVLCVLLHTYLYYNACAIAGIFNRGKSIQSSVPSELEELKPISFFISPNRKFQKNCISRNSSWLASMTHANYWYST